MSADSWRAEWLAAQKVKPRLTNCRMVRDVEASKNRRWYVFEGDWGGQIFLTIPVDMVPVWVDRRRLRRLLRLLNGAAWGCQEPEDGASVYIVEDVIGEPYWLTDEQSSELWRLNHDRAREIGVQIPDTMFEPFEPETRLPGWKAVGAVSGGMGGGVLLDGDLWVHYEWLFRGLEQINEIRRLLGLCPMESLEVVMTDEERWHAGLITAAL
jgi:hypothetical protein